MSRDLFASSRDPGVARYLAYESRSTSRDVLRRIVKRVGNDVAAKAADLDPSHLTAALGGKAGRNLDDHHIDAILGLATDTEYDDYFAARMKPRGKQPAEITPRTAEQRLADLEWRIAKAFGHAGVEIVEDERSRP